MTSPYRTPAHNDQMTDGISSAKAYKKHQLHKLGRPITPSFGGEADYWPGSEELC
jgi:hypothetical protein